MYKYNAYNLGISSALPLPELQASAEVEADVTIRVSHLDWTPPPQATQSDDLYFETNAAKAYFYWPQLGKFCVNAGTEIVIDPCAGVEERLLRLPLLGTVLAVLLHQRGHLVLHASAVAVNDESIIFVGHKGRGKSTMAATLYGRGHQLIADDVVALDFRSSGPPMVMPGFPQFKLYPEAVVSALGDDCGALPELAVGYEKRGRPVRDRFAKKPLPLAMVYALGCGPLSTLRALEPQAALLTVIANSYVARFGTQLLQGAEASAHLQQCARLISEVPIYRLERPSALRLLPTVAQLVEDHLQYI